MKWRRYVTAVADDHQWQDDDEAFESCRTSFDADAMRSRSAASSEFHSAAGSSSSDGAEYSTGKSFQWRTSLTPNPSTLSPS